MNCSYMRKRSWEGPKDGRKVRTVLHDLLAGVARAVRIDFDVGPATTTIAEAREAYRDSYGEEEGRRLDAVALACLEGGQREAGNEWMFQFLRTRLDAIYDGLEGRVGAQVQGLGR